jgi:hypothetical protein
LPYIKQEKRNQIDDDLESLIETIRTNSTNTDVAGNLNYTITKLLLKTYSIPENQNYRIYNEMVGILECIKLELYSMFVSPYEDKKIKENGPVIPTTE